MSHECSPFEVHAARSCLPMSCSHSLHHQDMDWAKALFTGSPRVPSASFNSIPILSRILSQCFTRIIDSPWIILALVLPLRSIGSESLLTNLHMSYSDSGTSTRFHYNSPEPSSHCLPEGEMWFPLSLWTYSPGVHLCFFN